MAVNKVVYGNDTVMDITDTTATNNTVIDGEVFYDRSGVRQVGTLGEATDNDYGLVKTNSAQSVTLNSDGQLVVGGRLGQYTDGGVYYPVDANPSGVGASSFLITDGAKNVKIATRSFAIMAGIGVTCKSALTGSTEYRITNSQVNRFILFAVRNGRIALNQTDAMENGTALITSIKFANGNDISAYFGGTENNNDIVITTDRTINPSGATTTIRCYGTNTSSDNVLVGQGVGASSGKSLSFGQSTYGGGVQTVAIGNSVHVMANNSVGMGHTILVNKQFCFGVGQGHDFTNANNGTSAVGTWSLIDANTKFAVGSGTAWNARKNAFEVTADGGIVLPSPNGTRWKITVDNNGNLTTTAMQ